MSVRTWSVAMMMRGLAMAAGGAAGVVGVAGGAMGMLGLEARGQSTGEALPTDPRVVQGEFANGMRYVVMQHAVPPGRAAVWLHVSSGSLNETDQQRGIAHFLEHMAFNGSTNFAPGTVVDFFQGMGLTFGRHQNASTRFDRTGYRLEMPDNKPETVEKALLFLSDVAFRLTLPSQEIEKERGVILEEKRTRLGAQQRVQEQWIQQLAPGSTLGSRLPIGVEETILGMNRQDFVDYYTRWYVPSNMAVMMVADMDAGAMVEMLRKHFGVGERKPRPADLPVGIRPYESSRGVVITDAELTRATVSVVRVGPPPAPITTKARMRERLVEQLGSLSFNRRLEKKVSQGKVSFLSGGVTAGPFLGTLHMAAGQASGKPETWRTMLADLGTEIQRARLHGFDETEVSNATREILARAEQEAQTASTRPAINFLNEWDAVLAEDGVLISAEQELALLRELTAGVRASEVSSVFAKTMDPSAVTYLLEAPSTIAVPSQQELLEAGKAAMAATPAKEESASGAKTLMGKLPEPGKVTGESLHEPTGVRTFTFGNGVVLHVRSMDDRKHQATVMITLAGGELLETAENRGISDAAAAAWSRPATSTLASTEIQDLMVGKKVGVNAMAQSDAMGFSVGGAPDDLEAGLQLVHLMLTDPAVEQAGFEQWSQQQRQGIAASKLSPRGVMTRLMASTVFPESEVRVKPLTEENIAALTSESVRGWMRRTAAESPIEVAVVGDISPERARDLVARYIASLPARAAIGPNTYAERRVLERPVGVRDASAKVKTQTDQSQVIVGFYGADLANVSDSRRLSAAAQIITTRMVQSLREKEQLVYSIRTSANPGVAYPGFGMVMAGAPTKPDKATTLARRIRELFAEFAEKGPSDEEVEVVKRQFANNLDEQRKDPGYWLRRVQTLRYRGLNLDDTSADDAAYAAMTGDEIRECFARYFNQNAQFSVIISPE